MSDYFTANVEMSIHECGSCGVTWAITKGYEDARREDHKTFYCPNGCSRHYPQENKEEKLKRLLNSERKCCVAAREEANTLERSYRAYKGHVTRLKARVS